MQSFPNRQLLLFLILLFLTAVSLNAETILLRNGKVLKGKVIGQSATTVTVQTSTGQQQFAKNQILKIVFQDVNEAEAKRIRLEELRKEREKKRQEELARKKAEAERKRQEEEKRKAELEAQKKEQERIAKEKKEALLAKQASATPTKIRMRDVLWRSAVAPGWGHFYAGEKKWGWVYSSAFAATFLYTLYSFTEYESAMQKYKSNIGVFKPVSNFAVITSPATQNLGIGESYLLVQSVDDDGRNFQKYKNASTQLNEALFLTIGIYAANLVHAYLTGKRLEASGATRQSWFFNTNYRYIPTANLVFGGKREIVYTTGYTFHF